MRMEESRSCDRCSSSIITKGYGERLPFQFVASMEADADELVFEEEVRYLCKKCEMEMLEWIDENDVDRSGQVHLPERVMAARTLHQLASDMESLANDLESSLSGGEA